MVHDSIRVVSGINVRFICDRYPKTLQSNFDHLIDGLRKAGLPEG
jgi:hypothetical protein